MLAGSMAPELQALRWYNQLAGVARRQADIVSCPPM